MALDYGSKEARAVAEKMRQNMLALERYYQMEELAEEITELGYSIDAHDYIPSYLDVPPLYSSERRENPLAMVKLFTVDQIQKVDFPRHTWPPNRSAEQISRSRQHCLPPPPKSIVEGHLPYDGFNSQYSASNCIVNL